jgi:hypothetical protein
MTNSRNTNNTTVNTSPIMRRGKSANQTAAAQTVQKPNASQDQEQTKWVQIRLIPIWLRGIIFFILLLIAVIAGLTVGYSILGDGDSSKVLEWSTWQHLFDIIKGKE